MNYSDVKQAIASRTEFQHTTMSARRYPAGYPFVKTGYLSRDYAEMLREDLSREALYVVFSYDTPIAWETASGIVRHPDVKYSVTTSKHLGYARFALQEKIGA